MLWVRVPPELMGIFDFGFAIFDGNDIPNQKSQIKNQNPDVLVEQRSARHPVTVEIVGSNPIGDVWEFSILDLRLLIGLQWKMENRKSQIENPFASAEHRRAQVAVTHPPCEGLKVQLLPGALCQSWSITGSGRIRLSVRTPVFQSG